MRMSLRNFRMTAAALLGAGLIFLASTAHAERIEAVKDKRYTLSKQHGPWMIMVATFHTTAQDGTTDVGTPPEEAADALVYELRSRNLPAYVYQITGDGGAIETIDAQGHPDHRKNLRKPTTWGVIAGNYKSLDDDLAQKSLGYLKKLKPKCLGPESGVVWYARQGEGPLRNAFLTTNPLLSHEEVVRREQELGNRGIDTLLVQLNSGENHSLLENKGQYTLQVAMFSGRRVVQNSLRESEFSFRSDRENPLDLAGQSAQELVLAMRQQYNLEAYVWHDHYQSIVTVGSFSSPSDPKLANMIAQFTEQERVIDQAAGVKQFGPAVFNVDHRNKDGQMTRMMLSCMSRPIVMEVPQIRPRSSTFARATERGSRK